MDQAITRAAGAESLAALREAAAPRAVGEFKGYIDGEPAVRWYDRRNMPNVGDKLFLDPARAAGIEPRIWSILLTSANHGIVGPLGSAFRHAGEHHERVQVVEIVEAGAPPAPGTDLAGLVRIDERTAVAAGDDDLLEVVRCLCSVAARRADLTPEKRKHYPHVDEEGSPTLMAARAACLARGYTQDGLAVEGVTYPVVAPSAPVGAIPAGWKLVPVEPNAEMLKAGAESEDKNFGLIIHNVYCAMIEAAPAISHSGEGEKGGAA